MAFLLAQVGGLAAIRFAERLDSLDLSPAHAGLLRAVAAEQGRSQQALATQLNLLPSKLVTLVDELERTRLLERRRHPVDRRNHALHLTPHGEERLRDIAQIAQEHGRELLATLEQQDRTDLGRILHLLADHHGLSPGIHPGYRTLGRPGTSVSESPA